MEYYRLGCCLYILFLLLVDSNLVYFTRWGLLSQFIYYLPIPYSELCEIGYVHFVWAITWTVAILITVVLAVDSTALDEAVDQYGWIAYIVHAMEHYLTVLLLFISVIRHPEIAYFIGRKYVIYGFLTVIVLGLYYIMFLNVDRYHV